MIDPLQPANFTTSAKELLAHVQTDQVMLVPASGKRALDGLAGTVTRGVCRTKSGAWETPIAWPPGFTTVTFGTPRSVHALLEWLAKAIAPAKAEEAFPTGVSTAVAVRSDGLHWVRCREWEALVAS